MTSGNANETVFFEVTIPTTASHSHLRYRTNRYFTIFSTATAQCCSLQHLTTLTTGVLTNNNAVALYNSTTLSTTQHICTLPQPPQN